MAPIYILIISGILLALVIFLLCRELVCWYFKYNIQIENQERMIKNQEKIITLLEKQYKLEEPEITTENNTSRMDTINPF